MSNIDNLQHKSVVLSKKKRHRWNTPRSSPGNRPNMGKKQFVGNQIKTMMLDWRKDNRGADLSGIGKLNINQLRKLAEELKLRIL